MQESVESGQLLGDYLTRQCEYYESLPALRILRDSRLSEITFGRLRELSMQIGLGLVRQGVRPGDRVVLVSPSSADWIIAYMAIQLVGAVDVAFDDQANSQQIREIVLESGAKLCMCERENVVRELRTYDDLYPVRMVHLSWRSIPGDAGYSSLSMIRVQRLAVGGLRRLAFMRSRRIPEDPASILYKRPDRVSGKPRAVVLSHKNILAHIASFMSTLPVFEDDALLLGLPLWHSSGRMGLFVTLNNAVPLCISRPDVHLKDVVQFQPTLALMDPDVLQDFMHAVVSGIPGESLVVTLLRRLYLRVARHWIGLASYIFEAKTDPEEETSARNWLALSLVIPALAALLPFKLSGDFAFRKEIQRPLGRRLRAVLTGGGPVSQRLDVFFETLKVPLLAGYWLSEATCVVASRTLVYTGQRSRLTAGTVGAMVPGLALKIVDHRGEDVSNMPGAVGTIHLLGDAIMQGYFKDPALTSEVLDETGWLRTMDRGYVTATGDLCIMNRQSRIGMV